MRLDQATPEQLRQWHTTLTGQYQSAQQAGLNLDLTRGKPCAEQLELSNALDGILQGDYTDASGIDLRNYGGLDGISEAKQLFAKMIGTRPEEVMIGGNGSLTLMYFCVQSAMYHGVDGPGSAWAESGNKIKFLAPVPGYDRHFSICEHLGIELIPIAMDDNGPDMDQVEAQLKADENIKGIWCVPRFSNPTGVVYSDEVVARIAQLGNIAGPHFRVFWDNAYAVHVLDKQAPALANFMDLCREAGTQDNAYIFGSTSKVTFAGAGVAFMASSPNNLKVLTKHLSYTSIGPDKINQMRHVRFLQDMDTLGAHMDKHAAILRPRFDAVLSTLCKELGDSDMGSWTNPQGGYFVCFDSRPGLAREIIQLAADAGVKLTPAGATYPHGNDPQDCNIRLAPTYPSLPEIEKAMEIFVLCVKLASVAQALEQ